MSWIVPPECVFCEHYHQQRNEQTDALPSCDAFDAIPDEIFMGSRDHSRPYPGDQGVRFSVSEEVRTDFLELNDVRRQVGLPVYRVPLKLVHSARQIGRGLPRRGQRPHLHLCSSPD